MGHAVHVGPLSAIQHKALTIAMSSQHCGLVRTKGGRWVGNADRKKSYSAIAASGEWVGSQTIQALVDRGLLVPSRSTPKGAYKTVTVEWPAARTVMAAPATRPALSAAR